MLNFVYLVSDAGSREALVVDSGWEVGPVLAAAEELGARIRYVVATHQHFDHTMTLADLAEKAGALTVAHAASPLQVDRRVSHGEKISLGSSSVTVLHTPGHTEDSICLYDGEHVFTGDTLFIGNCGRTDLPGGSPEKLFASLGRVIMGLPKETVVYPGHDYGDVPFRRLGDEELTNPCLRAVDIGAFKALPD